MSSSIKGLVVTFDRDISEEAVKSWISAINLMRCVADVRPVVANENLGDEIVERRVRRDMEQRLLEAVRTGRAGEPRG